MKKTDDLEGMLDDVDYLNRLHRLMAFGYKREAVINMLKQEWKDREPNERDRTSKEDVK